MNTLRNLNWYVIIGVPVLMWMSISMFIGIWTQIGWLL